MVHYKKQPYFIIKNKITKNFIHNLNYHYFNEVFLNLIYGHVPSGITHSSYNFYL